MSEYSKFKLKGLHRDKPPAYAINDPANVGVNTKNTGSIMSRASCPKSTTGLVINHKPLSAQPRFDWSHLH